MLWFLLDPIPTVDHQRSLPTIYASPQSLQLEAGCRERMLGSLCEPKFLGVSFPE
jgi:hypothetical protein